MKLDQKCTTKLASLSALGAGALVAGLGTANAAPIVQTLPPGKVGFDSGYNPSFGATNSLFGGAGFNLFTQRNTGGTVSEGKSRRIMFSGLGAGLNFKFATSDAFLKIVGSGATLGAANLAGAGKVATRFWITHIHTTTFSSTYTTRSHKRSPAPFSNKYALFTFTFDAQTYDGWVELSLDKNANVSGTSANLGPDMTITEWAFDSSNLPAGSTGSQGAVPEPGTLASTALGALMLGALGVRRWKQAKRAA